MKLSKLIVIIIIPIFFSGCCAYKVFPGGKHYCNEIKFKDFVKDGEYIEAHRMFIPYGLELATYDYQISYDILNVLVYGKKIAKKDLLIYDTYKKYPDSIAWTMLAAKILVIYIDTGKIDKETVELFEKYVPKHSKHNYFWLKALKDLESIKS